MDLIDYREGVVSWLIEKARNDDRIVAAAAVGSTAIGGDRWSDVDLTFAVATGVPIEAVLAEWSIAVVDQFDAAELFDVQAGAAIYRVFLLPGVLQVDLSFAPEVAFAPTTPRFRLIFGAAGAPVDRQSSQVADDFGLAVHHVVRVRVCIERGKLLQAEYWLHQARDIALTMACAHRGLSTHHGRGFDDLPEDVRTNLLKAMPAELSPAELRRALRALSASLMREADATSDQVNAVAGILDGWTM